MYAPNVRELSGKAVHNLYLFSGQSGFDEA